MSTKRTGPGAAASRDPKGAVVEQPQPSKPTAKTTQASLSDIAKQIKAAHDDVVRLLHKTFTRAIEAGELLLEAKSLLDHGEWLPWVEANCEINIRTAQVYMRIAKHREELGANAENFSHLTVDAALQLLKREEVEVVVVERKLAPTQTFMVVTKPPPRRPEPPGDIEWTLRSSGPAPRPTSDAPDPINQRWHCPCPNCEKTEAEHATLDGEIDSALRDFAAFTIANIASGDLKLSGDSDRMRRWHDLKDRVEPHVGLTQERKK